MLILISLQIFVLLLHFRGTQTLQGYKQDMTGHQCQLATLISNNSSVCGSQMPWTHKSAISVSALADPYHHTQLALNSWWPNQRSEVAKCIPNLIVPRVTKSPKQQSRESSILNGAQKPSYTEGKNNDGFL